MKTLKVLFLLLCSAGLLNAQGVEFGSHFNLSQPLGTMANNMSNSAGLTFAAAKNFKAPFSLGLEVNFGTYGYQTSRQEYIFDDGSVTETDVNVSNNIAMVTLTGKHFFRNDKKIKPYLSGKAGWASFTTRLTIEDPEDEYSCHPLESDILAKDHTYVFSGGAGARIDFSAIFKKMDAGLFSFDLSVHSTRGGPVSYMNSERDPRQPIPDRDVMAKFINTQTQVIHEHHVGYIYNNVLNMVEYRLGVVFTPYDK
jgi:hypothetical protein